MELYDPVVLVAGILDSDQCALVKIKSIDAIQIGNAPITELC